MNRKEHAIAGAVVTLVCCHLDFFACCGWNWGLAGTFTVPPVCRLGYEEVGYGGFIDE